MSNIFYKNKPVIGLDVSKTSMRIMSIDKNKMLVHGYGFIMKTKYYEAIETGIDTLETLVSSL